MSYMKAAGKAKKRLCKRPQALESSAGEWGGDKEVRWSRSISYKSISVVLHKEWGFGFILH